MKYVDFHCHLDNYPDFESLALAIDRAGIYTLAVTTTPSTWDISETVCANTRHLRAALGLHPHFAESHFDELRIFESLLPRTRYVGEVGIDGGPVGYSSIGRQTQAFIRILECCSEHGEKILSIHSFRAARRVIDALESKFEFDRGVAVLHWFTGSVSEAKRAVDLGCYFSVNERMASSPNGSKVLQVVPLDRILTETDGPFIKAGRTAALPTDVGRAVQSIASALHLDEGTVCMIVAANFKRLVGSALERSFALRDSQS